MTMVNSGLKGLSGNLFFFADTEIYLFVNVSVFVYCRAGNIREVLIFASTTNLLIQECHENYYYNSSTKKKWKFVRPKPREKSRNQKFTKIKTQENYRIYSIC